MEWSRGVEWFFWSVFFLEWNFGVVFWSQNLEWFFGVKIWGEVLLK